MVLTTVTQSGKVQRDGIGQVCEVTPMETRCVTFRLGIESNGEASEAGTESCDKTRTQENFVISLTGAKMDCIDT